MHEIKKGVSMFGLFKSKEAKQAEQIVAELRKVISRYYDGNVVNELGSIIHNRYKLTISTFEEVRSGGLLPGLEGSGGIAVAISKDEILFFTYEPSKQKTKVQLAIYPENMLDDVEKNLIEDGKVAKHREGSIYKNDSDVISFVGALTILGCEVGISREDGNFFPFKYDNNNFLIAKYNGHTYIVYEEA